METNNHSNYPIYGHYSEPNDYHEADFIENLFDEEGAFGEADCAGV